MSPFALLCFLALFRNVFGCPCTDDCEMPAENGCSEGLNPLCELNGNVCACACVATEAKEGSEVELNIQITKEAAAVFDDTGYDLTIFKGYKTGTEETFDTAWHVVDNSALVMGSLELSWTSYTKAAFVTEVEENSIIVHQGTTTSEQFGAGQVVVFNNSGWSEPSTSETTSDPNFEVEYDIADHPMHLTLLALTPENSTEEWSPYFYDEFAMDQYATMVGYPSSSLYIQPTRYIQAGSFTGTAYTTGKKVDYENTLEMTICCSTTDNSQLIITTGECPTNSGTEVA